MLVEELVELVDVVEVAKNSSCSNSASALLSADSTATSFFLNFCLCGTATQYKTQSKIIDFHYS